MGDSALTCPRELERAGLQNISRRGSGLQLVAAKKAAGRENQEPNTFVPDLDDQGVQLTIKMSRLEMQFDLQLTFQAPTLQDGVHTGRPVLLLRLESGI